MPARSTIHSLQPAKAVPPPAVPETERAELLQRVREAMERTRQGETSLRRALGLQRGKSPPHLDTFFEQAARWVDSRSLKAADRVEERLPGFRGLELRAQVLLVRLWVMERWLQGEALEEAGPRSGA